MKTLLDSICILIYVQGICYLIYLLVVWPKNTAQVTTSSKTFQYSFRLARTRFFSKSTRQTERAIIGHLNCLKYMKGHILWCANDTVTRDYITIKNVHVYYTHMYVPVLM